MPGFIDTALFTAFLTMVSAEGDTALFTAFLTMVSAEGQVD